jgi:hypothetical protein
MKLVVPGIEVISHLSRPAIVELCCTENVLADLYMHFLDRKVTDAVCREAGWGRDR